MRVETFRWIACSFSAMALLWVAMSTSQAQTVVYYHTDALGSPVAVTDANGVVVERSEYEPYGKLSNRPLTDGPGYTGHVADSATGLLYMQQRYYDPELARFLSVDPVSPNPSTGKNFNRYWYANNNPYKFTDPDGREAGFTYNSDGSMSHFYTENPLPRKETAVLIADVVVSVTADLALGGPTGEGVAIFSAIRGARATESVVDAVSDVSRVNPKALISRQGRDEMSGSQIKRMAKDMKANGYDASKPIDVADVGGKKVIIDGHHRAAAAVKAGIDEVPVRTTPVTPQQGSRFMQEAAEARRLER